MTNPAETTPPTGGEPQPSAAGAELQIPKYRLDEVSAELKRLREEVQIKDRLYMEDRQRMSAQQQQTQPADLTPEETGLDPQTHAAVIKAAKLIADRAIKQEKTVFSQQLGMLANRTEKAELLAVKGADKAKYIPEIEKLQQDHYRQTGGYIPAETALDILLSKEKDERIRQLEAKLANQPAAPTPPTVQTPSAPSAAGTRQIPSAAAAPTQKGFSEGSIEEMEARLEEQFKNGSVL